MWGVGWLVLAWLLVLADWLPAGLVELALVRLLTSVLTLLMISVLRSVLTLLMTSILRSVLPPVIISFVLVFEDELLAPFRL